MFLKNREKLLQFSVRDLIDLRAKEIPDLPFLLTPANPRPINFQQLKDHCSRISLGLEASGVEEGQTVATMMPNGLASTLLNLSIFYKGKTLCPLNLAAGDMQISYVLEHSESRLLLVASELRARAEAILKTLSNPPEMVEIAADEIPFENAVNHVDERMLGAELGGVKVTWIRSSNIETEILRLTSEEATRIGALNRRFTILKSKLSDSFSQE